MSLDFELKPAAAPQHQSADTLPLSRSAEVTRRRPGRLGFFRRVASAIADFFGPFETGSADYLYVCRECRDAHTDPRECEFAEIGECAICLDVVDLDRYGWCAEGGQYHTITNRRKRIYAPAYKREVMGLR